MRQVRSAVYVHQNAVPLEMEVGDHDAVAAIRAHTLLVQALLQLRRTHREPAVYVHFKPWSAQRQRLMGKAEFGQQHAHQFTPSCQIQRFRR